MDGVSPEVPKVQGSFAPRGVLSTSLRSSNEESRDLWKQLVITLVVLLTCDNRRFLLSEISCIIRAMLSESYLDVAEMSSASARDVATGAAALIPNEAWFNPGNLALKVEYSSSLGFCDVRLRPLSAFARVKANSQRLSARRGSRSV